MDDWLARVLSLRVWSRDGQRAPHKPLLLLMVLARLQREEPAMVSFGELEAPLTNLLRDFGPARRSHHPEFPFHHLASDGLWKISTPDGGDARPLGTSVARLRQSGAAGRLDPAFEAALHDDGRFLAATARVLLDGNFPSTLHEDLLQRLGLELAPLEVAAPSRRRAAAFRDQVLVAYEYRCAMCGYDGWLDRDAVGLDAAHVRWWAVGGPDTIDNALFLCSLHHRLLDRGALGIGPDRTVAVSQRFVGRAAAARSHVLDLSGQPLLTPQTPHPPIAQRHAEWHAREVFRAPARSAA